MVETTFGSRLRDALTECGMTLAALSEKAGLVYSSIQNYAADKQNPGAEALAKIARATGINLNWLLTGEGDKFIKNIPAAKREMLLRDYIDLRNKFLNFDEVFILREIRGLSDTNDTIDEYRKMLYRNIIRSMKDLGIGDIRSHLAGRDLGTMSEAELDTLLRQIVKTV